MFERAIPIHHPRIALDAAQDEPASASARARLRAFRDQAFRGIKRALRFLGHLAEAGGPLS
ncbi:hypothetical protein [Bradyrhizobium sp.]|uniref:hypothetical protein n=1 Tax=Bradyrhizobium sp. TaxID=376 RepID=UPI001EC92463|nr:hypothetical protein [Bradyrhizobium sp.]MBV8920499.1 hypothetical protein [Bradyrhizobium sp.]MBV9981219.1 hypothetical protein [Bradyrhizobium sp.]